MADTVIPLDKFRTGKAYTVLQAARLADISTRTANRWLFGDEVAGWPTEPLFGKRQADATQSVPMLSFLDLVELVIAARFRKRSRRLTPERIRKAHKFAREQWNLPYPFASLHLLEWGGHLLRAFDDVYPGAPSESLLALDMKGQPTLPGLVKIELEENIIFLPDRFAGLWYPRGRTTPIVVDPHVAAGVPTIEGTGITVATVFARWQNDESIKSLARDYGLSVDVLDRILHLARPKRAA